jgi:hypothetical protein
VDTLEQYAIHQHRAHMIAYVAIDLDANTPKWHIGWVSVSCMRVLLLARQHYLSVGRACNNVL